MLVLSGHWLSYGTIISTVRLLTCVLKETCWWKRTISGWWRCTTAFRTRWISTWSWSFFLEVMLQIFLVSDSSELNSSMLKSSKKKTTTHQQSLPKIFTV